MILLSSDETPEQEFEISAETFDDAIRALRLQMPKGYQLMSLNGHKSGKQEILIARGVSVDDAIEKALRDAPPDSTVLESKEINSARSIRVVIDAYDESGARSKAKDKMQRGLLWEDGRIAKLELIKPGSKGFLFFNRIPNSYGVDLFQDAKVEVVLGKKYMLKAMARLCTREENAIRKVLTSSLRRVLDGSYHCGVCDQTLLEIGSVNLAFGNYRNQYDVVETQSCIFIRCPYCNRRLLSTHPFEFNIQDFVHSKLNKPDQLAQLFPTSEVEQMIEWSMKSSRIFPNPH
jgi:hypothetical protein